MKKNWLIFSFSIMACLALLAVPAAAQDTDEALRLNVSKTLGYSSGFGSGNIKLQGIMKLTARGPEDLQRVVFYLDEAVMGEVSQAPFVLQFNTDNHAMGLHTLYAVGFASGGGELRSNEVKVEFVTAEAGWQDAMRIVGPILALVFGIMLFAFLVPTILERGKKGSAPLGAKRNYGIFGGSICPKCQRPFALHLYGMNLLTHKLDRCPNCGKWSFVRPLPLSTLRAAEEAELAMAQGVPQVSTMTEEEKLRKKLEESRYD